jgi:hypothetical protein
VFNCSLPVQVMFLHLGDSGGMMDHGEED